jgi:hypothetical protein
MIWTSHFCEENTKKPSMVCIFFQMVTHLRGREYKDDQD